MFLFSFPRVLLYFLVSGNYFTISSCAAGDSRQAFSDPSGLLVTSSAPPWWTAVITTTSQSLTAPLPTSPASPVWPHSLSASPALLLPRQPYLGPTPPARSVHSVQSGFVQQCWTRWPDRVPVLLADWILCPLASRMRSVSAEYSFNLTYLILVGYSPLRPVPGPWWECW